MWMKGDQILWPTFLQSLVVRKKITVLLFWSMHFFEIMVTSSHTSQWWWDNILLVTCKPDKQDLYKTLLPYKTRCQALLKYCHSFWLILIKCQTFFSLQNSIHPKLNQFSCEATTRPDTQYLVVKYKQTFRTSDSPFKVSYIFFVIRITKGFTAGERI
jgi:hypothetical protein